MTIPKDVKRYLSYCSGCGSKEIVDGMKKIGYDKLTGKPNFIYVLKCPKARWWNNHDVEEINYHITNTNKYVAEQIEKFAEEALFI